MISRLLRSTAWHSAVAVLLFSVSCGCVASPEDPAQSDGVLLIAGGAVKAGNASLHEAFVDSIPGDLETRVAIISAASGSPIESAERFREILIGYGVPHDDIVVVRLAVRDDDSTPEVDESHWSDNAVDPAEVAKVAGAGAIWMTGGDQSRLTQVLYDEDGRPTPLLAAMRKRLSEGAIIGGTSAGAAVMSNPMITGGDSIAALLGLGGEALTMGNGLGFFEHGLVDQHFGERARLGRLAIALEQLDPARRIGFGVDENTALLYDGAANTVSVVGVGNVTFLDARSATWTPGGNGVSISGLEVSVLSPGDRLDLDDGAFRPADYFDATTGSEYNDRPPLRGGGIAIAFSGLAGLLGGDLLDNKGATRIDRYAFVVDDPGEGDGAAGAGVRYRFSQDSDSEGYWGYGPDGSSRYSVVRVGLDITPLRVTLETANE